MLHFIKICGFFGWPLVLLTLTIAVLTVMTAVRLAAGAGAAGPGTARRINTILFWGVMATVMGFLGQCMGIYNSMQVIMRAEAIAPNLVAQGFAESFTTTLFGLTLLLFSGLAWVALRTWHGRLLETTGGA